jgi:hypothetical protein
MFAAVRETISKLVNRRTFRCCSREFWSSALMLMLSASSLIADDHTTQQSGKVESGDAPIASSSVTLYEAGRSQHTTPTVLGKGKTDDS